MNGKKIKSISLDFVYMLIGSMIYALCINALTAPNNIAPGGITGVATMLNFLFDTPIGAVGFIINVPIIIWAILEIGYKLVVKTIIAIVLNSFMIDLFATFVPAYDGDPIIVAICAGVCEGVGLSLTFMRGATTGGTDMLSRLLTRRMPHFSIGKMMLILDGAIVIASAFVFNSLESALYACIVIFVSTSLIDAILYGTDIGTGKMFFVMSPKVREMGDRIINEMDRTITYLDSHGGYTKEPGEVMMCAVRRFEVFQLKSIIQQVDKNAFLIVGDAGEITGEGFKSMHSDDKPLMDVIKKMREGDASADKTENK